MYEFSVCVCFLNLSVGLFDGNFDWVPKKFALKNIDCGVPYAKWKVVLRDWFDQIKDVAMYAFGMYIQLDIKACGMYM